MLTAKVWAKNAPLNGGLERAARPAFPEPADAAFRRTVTAEGAPSLRTLQKEGTTNVNSLQLKVEESTSCGPLLRENVRERMALSARGKPSGHFRLDDQQRIMWNGPNCGSIVA